MTNYNDHKAELILRDYLALDRTKLANERTFLSYIRTFIGALTAGIGLVKLTDDYVLIILGFALAAVSPLFLLVGLYRFIKGQKALRKLDKK